MKSIKMSLTLNQIERFSINYHLLSILNPFEMNFFYKKKSCGIRISYSLNSINYHTGSDCIDTNVEFWGRKRNKILEEPTLKRSNTLVGTKNFHPYIYIYIIIYVYICRLCP